MEKSTIPPDLCLEFSRLIENKLGLHLPKSDLGNWENRLFSLAQALGFSDLLECLKWLTSKRLEQEEVNVLIHHLTIGETYFFRDPISYDAWEKVILPELIDKRKESKTIKIWCAASCTGEEPYSVAILLHSLLPDFIDWDITILASDINAEFLRKCEKGVYKEWSFRATPPLLRKKYFAKDKQGNEVISAEIKAKVKFMCLNLIEDQYPSSANVHVHG